MFHNNYKLYQINFNLFSIEVEYWNEYTDRADRLIFELDQEQTDNLINLLTQLGFNDNTPE